MDGSYLWFVLLAVSAVIERLARLDVRRCPLGRVGAGIATYFGGRLLPALLWMFVRFHLFSRYTRTGR